MRWLALVAVMVVSSTAFADEPTAEQRALARTLFDDGRTLVKEGRYAEACPKLEESERLAPGIGTLFNLGDCYEKLGRTASAWSAFSEVADAAHRSGQPDRETVARERANALAPKLTKIRLDVDKKTAPPGLEVILDGKSLTGAVIGSEIPVDPGDHRVSSRAGDRTSKEVIVRAEVPGAIVLVDVPPLAAPPPRIEAPAAALEATPAPSDWHRPAALVAGGLGVLAIGAGTFFGLRASSEWSDGQTSCPNNVCNDAGYEHWHDARSSATASTIAFVAGAALVTGAVVLWATAPSSKTTGTR